jgi:hypothetical protein
MKTQLINNNHLKEECEDYFNTHSLQSYWSRLLAATRQMMMSLKSSGTQVVHQIYPAGLDAYQMRQIIVTAVNELWSNKRTRIGFVVGLLAVPSWFSQFFFDINARYDWFYYVNWVFYFNTIRAYLVILFISVGGFLILPTKVGYRWIAAPLTAFACIEIYEQSLYTDYTDFYKAMPDYEPWTLIVLSAFALVMVVNYLCYRKYHLKDGNAARVIGVLRMDVSWEMKKELLLKLKEESENYNNRI